MLLNPTKRLFQCLNLFVSAEKTIKRSGFEEYKLSWGDSLFEKSKWGRSHSNLSWTYKLLWINCFVVVSNKTSLLMIAYVVYINSLTAYCQLHDSQKPGERDLFLSFVVFWWPLSLSFKFQITRCLDNSETVGDFQAVVCYCIYDRGSVNRWTTEHLHSIYEKN